VQKEDLEGKEKVKLDRHLTIRKCMELEGNSTTVFKREDHNKYPCTRPSKLLRVMVHVLN
jgi:hypothetical protein